MPLLIDQKVVADDHWVRVDDTEQLAQLGNNPAILAWELFSQQRDELLAADGELAVAIPNDLDVVELEPLLERLSVIAVDFPSFADGRAFSQARLLRRAGFKGQIRASGDVTRDRLRFMHRCGIDAMEIAEDRFSPEMLGAFGEISVNNQGAEDDPRPIYRQ
ncbi:DUF934 domain-containing protein [Motiliproteus coralliicola]|uniref:DUF934 domain-containing protein n=1 Tax=Motiliproteus coralliicola TaxID=2283196 RepID=A0A369WFU3_9GAMM|nr:DUF934 domain-containing protein [Motiliproteus coralliicola]RDE19466.1 DUF934 domain-containing protein [Motiliproteus coralliicola]